MISIGCAGFSRPAPVYFKEFAFVEVGAVSSSTPGMGTIRRWRREAPPGFRYAILAPREIGQEGFREGKVTENALKNLSEMGKELEALIAVFAAPPEFTASRTNKSALKEFLSGVVKKFERVVWEPPPAWDADDAQSLALDAGATAARDPLAHGTTGAAFAYYRLPGPAGHKSRYEDPAIDRLADLASASKNEEAAYVFTNVDMFADAKRLKKALKM
jgi:uncharacterized protein YecE (DUF72 family)